jgi:lipoate-protein ligase A
MQWQLLDTGKRHAAWNMAIDEALLLTCESHSLPVLRFYQWENPTLSLGYFQNFSEVNVIECERMGIDWIRRPTGGRAVLHDDELTYSVIAPLEKMSTSIEVSYEMLSEALAIGIKKLGLYAQLTTRHKSRDNKNPVCFVAPAYSELTIYGKKVIGSAQMRTKHALLQHGSIPITLDRERLVRIFNLECSHATLELIKEQSAGLRDFLTQSFDLSKLKNCICEGFKEKFGMQFIEIEMSEPVKNLACQLFAEKYSTQGWNTLR